MRVKFLIRNLILLSVLMSVSMTSLTYAEPPERPVETIKGEIIEIHQDLKSITLKHFLHPRGEGFTDEVYERLDFYADSETVYARRRFLHKFENLHDGDVVTIEYYANEKNEFIITYIER